MNPDDPVFPTNSAYFKGLTKHEYFAGLAMQGLLANPGGPIQANGRTGWGLTNCDYGHVSDCAVGFSDALIESLNKPTL